MDKLNKAREEINEIDEKMRELFTSRMNAVKRVSEYKIEHGLPTYDSVREALVIDRNASHISDPEMRGYYIQFLQKNMDISRAYQEKLKSGMKVAYSGVEGAYAHIAACKIFKTAQKISYPNFKAAYEAVLAGECDTAVLPIENSSAGEVGAVCDMLFSGPLCITGVYDLPIYHNLVAKKGAKLSDIREVISHPQALSQCGAYIESKGFVQTEAENTARAAKHVARGDSLSVAAIASEETAELYGLDILERRINEKNINTTRFATLSRVAFSDTARKDRHFIMMFTVKNEAGSLSKAIGIIGNHGYNMRCLRSRPMKELLWNYYFYVEAEGNIDTENGRSMLAELELCCDKLKVMGSFKYPNELK